MQVPATPQSQQQQLAVAGVEGTEVVSVKFMREEREHMEAKLEEQRQETTKLRLEMEKRLAPKEVISAEQVDAVTARLEALHAAQLLSDEELFALEDCMADFIEARAAVDVVTMETVNTVRAVGKMHKLVSLSEGLGDPALARQLRRKFVGHDL